MKIYCDLFLDCQINDNSLKFLELLDRNFKYNQDKLYHGYLNISVERLKLIPLISIMKNKKINYYSVPLQYKNNTNITEQESFQIAKKSIKYKEIELLIDSKFNHHTPLFYSFKTVFIGNNPNGFMPNNIMIDKIDGHLWSDFEYDKYMYDFNLRF